MVWKTALLILGLILFAVCLYFFLKRKEDKRARRIFGTAAYFGLGIVCLAVILLGEVIFTRINILWMLAGVFAIFFLAAKLLIAPGFKTEEKEGQEQGKE